MLLLAQNLSIKDEYLSKSFKFFCLFLPYKVLLENKLSNRFGYAYLIFLIVFLYLATLLNPFFLLLDLCVFELIIFGSVGYLLIKFDKNYKEKLDSFLYTSYFRSYFLGNPLTKSIRLGVMTLGLWGAKVSSSCLEFSVATKLAKQWVLDAREVGLEPDISFFNEKFKEAHKNMPVQYSTTLVKEQVSKIGEIISTSSPTKEK